MEAYNDFTAVDLALDERFLNWVRYPGMYPELDDFWKSWLQKNPHKFEEVSEAKRLIEAVYEEGEAVAIRQQEDEIWQRLSAETMQNPSRSPHRIFLPVAASIALVLVLLGAYFFSIKEVVVSAPVASMITISNSGSAHKMTALSDGSTISLAPGSTLSYPHVFAPSRREVTLVGQATFDITKNPEKPFFVFTDRVTTKVLGTKFTVSAFAGEPDILVEVQSGKVAVQIADARTKTSADPNNSVLLTPNQTVRYSRADNKLSKSLVDKPMLITSPAEAQFVFKDAAIKEIFLTLERAYGVTIVYDEEVMSRCYLTAALNDLPLFEKMRLICKTLEAKYEVLDSQIVVTGPGCN